MNVIGAPAVQLLINRNPVKTDEPMYYYIEFFESILSLGDSIFITLAGSVSLTRLERITTWDIISQTQNPDFFVCIEKWTWHLYQGDWICSLIEEKNEAVKIEGFATRSRNPYRIFTRQFRLKVSEEVAP